MDARNLFWDQDLFPTHLPPVLPDLAPPGHPCCGVHPSWPVPQWLLAGGRHQCAQLSPPPMAGSSLRPHGVTPHSPHLPPADLAHRDWETSKGPQEGGNGSLHAHSSESRCRESRAAPGPPHSPPKADPGPWQVLTSASTRDGAASTGQTKQFSTPSGARQANLSTE